jgi:hypothetical protein
MQRPFLFLEVHEVILYFHGRFSEVKIIQLFPVRMSDLQPSF